MADIQFVVELHRVNLSDKNYSIGEIDLFWRYISHAEERYFHLHYLNN